MLITGLTITLVFAALGLVTALLVATHDALEARLQRRALRSLKGGGGQDSARPTPRRAGRRSVPTTLPVLAEQAPAVPQNGGQAWLENAQRDVAHRRAST